MTVKNKRMKIARVEKDLSQQQLADMVGVTRQTIGTVSYTHLDVYKRQWVPSLLHTAYRVFILTDLLWALSRSRTLTSGIQNLSPVLLNLVRYKSHI